MTVSNPAVIELANSLKSEINSYIAARQKGDAQNLPEEFQIKSRQRLMLVLKSYLEISSGVCKDCFYSHKFHSSEDCSGIYLGLLPVSTLSEMNKLKSAHPVSVFFYSKAKDDDQYLLMMTDCLGRNSYNDSEKDSIENLNYQYSKPELRGITAFKSVLGIPEDRIKKLEQIFRQSISIGSWIGNLYNAFPDVKNPDVNINDSLLSN